jgi:DNA polymerase
MDLQTVQETAATCELCDLYKGRNKPVFARGNPKADMVACGMCPGPRENNVGYPFVGDAGAVLDEVLYSIFSGETEPSDYVNITNLVKCYVKPGTKLLEEWMIRCLPYFVAQIHFIQPKVIVGLGGDVCNFLLNNDLKIGQMRGKEYSYMGAKFIPTYHPSYLLRGGGIKHRHFNFVVGDFKKALSYF